jgi:hypothetical protein
MSQAGGLGELPEQWYKNEFEMNKSKYPVLRLLTETPLGGHIDRITQGKQLVKYLLDPDGDIKKFIKASNSSNEALAELWQQVKGKNIDFSVNEPDRHEALLARVMAITGVYPDKANLKADVVKGHVQAALKAWRTEQGTIARTEQNNTRASSGEDQANEAEGKEEEEKEEPGAEQDNESVQSGENQANEAGGNEEEENEEDGVSSVVTEHSASALPLSPPPEHSLQLLEELSLVLSANHDDLTREEESMGLWQADVERVAQLVRVVEGRQRVPPQNDNAWADLLATFLGTFMEEQRSTQEWAAAWKVIKDVDSDLSPNHTSVLEAKKKLAAAKKDGEKEMQDLRSYKSNAESRIKLLEDENDELRAKTQLSKQVDEIQQDKENLEAELSQAKAIEKELSSELAQVKEKLQQLQQKQPTTASSDPTKELQLQKLEASLLTKESQLLLANKAVEEYKEQVAQYQTTAQSQFADGLRQRKELGEFKSEAEKLKEDIQTRDITIGDLERQLSAAQREPSSKEVAPQDGAFMFKLQQEAESRAIELRHAELRLGSMRNRINEQRWKLDTVLEKINTLKTDMQPLSTSFESLHGKYAQTVQKLEAAQATVQQLQAAQARLQAIQAEKKDDEGLQMEEKMYRESQLHELQEQIATLQGQLAEAKFELDVKVTSSLPFSHSVLEDDSPDPSSPRQPDFSQYPRRFDPDPDGTKLVRRLVGLTI